MTESSQPKSMWRPSASVPRPLTNSRFVIEPLNETHAELDFEALMSCRARMREELQWNGWPPDDFTVDANRSDLQGHRTEFERGEAFAYTVLRHDRARCLGCIYIERCVAVAGAQLAYWVIDDAIDMEIDLVSSSVQWLHSGWSVNLVVIPLREANTRGLALAAVSGFSTLDSLDDGILSDYRCFLSECNDGKERVTTTRPALG